MKVANPGLTPSGVLLEELLKHDKDNGVYGLELAARYQEQMKGFAYQQTTEAMFTEAAETSLAAQADVEAADTKDFDSFIRDYFNEPLAKKNAW